MAYQGKKLMNDPLVKHALINSVSGMSRGAIISVRGFASYSPLLKEATKRIRAVVLNTPRSTAKIPKNPTLIIKPFIKKLKKPFYDFTSQEFMKWLSKQISKYFTSETLNAFKPFAYFLGVLLPTAYVAYNLYGCWKRRRLPPPFPDHNSLYGLSRGIANQYHPLAARQYKEGVVSECIQGYINNHRGLRLIGTKIVVRTDLSSDRVAVISGGGSGHEPAGFVGKGMLTVAICGNVFASPPVDAILAGIRAVKNSKGCLLIVKNYIDDRLNYGLAAEVAQIEGINVKMVIVGDDCAVPSLRGGTAGCRGLAGIILVFKVAGAAAEAQLSFEEIVKEAQKAASWVVTMGVGISICKFPGQVTRWDPGKTMLGIGIRGEVAATVVDFQPMNVIISQVLKHILSKETNTVSITRGKRVVLMINGLGATPLRDLMIIAGKAVSILQLEHGLAIDKVYTGSFMTSLDMAGFSISIMRADSTIMNLLIAPTNAPYWPVDVEGLHVPVKLPIPVKPYRPQKVKRVSIRPKKLSMQGVMLETVIKAAANSLISLRENLNDWDRKVGDGDCGSTMSRGATAILEDMKKHYPLNDAVETINEIGCSIRRVMGGTSGIMYSIFFKAAYAKLKESCTVEVSVTPLQWAGAFEAAIASVTKYGGAQAGFRTLLDAFIPALAVLTEKLNEVGDPLDVFLLSAEAAMTGAESTINMRAQAGRSTDVSAEALGTVPDPGGAMAAATWYTAAVLAAREKGSTVVAPTGEYSTVKLVKFCTKFIKRTVSSFKSLGSPHMHHFQSV